MKHLFFLLIPLFVLSSCNSIPEEDKNNEETTIKENAEDVIRDTEKTELIDITLPYIGSYGENFINIQNGQETGSNSQTRIIVFYEKVNGNWEAQREMEVIGGEVAQFQSETGNEYAWAIKGNQPIPIILYNGMDELPIYGVEQ